MKGLLGMFILLLFAGYLFGGSLFPNIDSLHIQLHFIIGFIFLGIFYLGACISESKK